jgi:hypothetical protein
MVHEAGREDNNHWLRPILTDLDTATKLLSVVNAASARFLRWVLKPASAQTNITLVLHTT